MAKTKLLPSTYKAYGGSAAGGNKPKPRSIIQQAIAGHPNWAGNVPLVPGVGSAGSALLGTGSQPGSPTPTPAPAAPAPAPAAPVAPFATEAQQLAWQAYLDKYNAQVGNLNQRLTDAIFSTNTNLQNAQHMHDVNYDMDNQSLAARGLFQSSIRDGELNDLDTALTMRQNTLNSALNSLRLQIGTDITGLNSDYNSQAYNYYQEQVTNAAAITPDVTAGTPPPPAPGQVNPNAAPQPNPSVSQAGTAILGGRANALTGGVASAGSALVNNPPSSLAAGLSKIGSTLVSSKASTPKPPGAKSAGSGLTAVHPSYITTGMHIGAPA